MASFCALDHNPSPPTYDLTAESVVMENHRVQSSTTTSKAVNPIVKYNFRDMEVLLSRFWSREMNIIDKH